MQNNRSSAAYTLNQASTIHEATFASSLSTSLPYSKDEISIINEDVLTPTVATYTDDDFASWMVDIKEKKK